MNGSAATTGQISKSAAEIYDEFFVPALFGEWAGRLCDRAKIGPHHVVLDVACGTGSTTREAASRLTNGNVIGLDRNADMLRVAQRKAPHIEWIESRAEDLSYPDNTFDTVLCQFGAMFFDDGNAALQHMARVLRPGGNLAFSVWDDAENSPGYDGMIKLIDQMFGAQAADALRAPFVLGDQDRLFDLCRNTGLRDARVTTVPGTARFASIREWVRMDVRGWTLAEFIDDAGFEALVSAAEATLGRFAAADGTVTFPAPAHICVWQKPAVH